VDEPRQATLEHLIDLAHEAADRRSNPLARLDAALMDAATSPADPYLIIDALLQTIPHIIAARIPLHQQGHIADEVEARLSEALGAWRLKLEIALGDELPVDLPMN
jgi:hypothetical protein